MPHPLGDLNAICTECGSDFHNPPSSKLIRCRDCRGGKQGKGIGDPKTSRVCSFCGGVKSPSAKRCNLCREKRNEDIRLVKSGKKSLLDIKDWHEAGIVKSVYGYNGLKPIHDFKETLNTGD